MCTMALGGLGYVFRKDRTTGIAGTGDMAAGWAALTACLSRPDTRSGNWHRVQEGGHNHGTVQAKTGVPATKEGRGRVRVGQARATKEQRG